MKNFNEYINESILDNEQPTHSPELFDILSTELKLKDSVREQILIGIGILAKYMHIIDYTLIGSILTRRYASDSDIDINIQISAKDEDMEKLASIAKQFSGKLVEGTKHPINYHILNDIMDFDNANNSADGVFDISNNKFIRKPIEKPFYIEDYLSKFKSLINKIDILSDNLEDELMDYSELQKLPKLKIQNLHAELNRELLDIEDNVKKLIDIYKQVKHDREQMFSREMTPKEIALYGVKNRLPQNVIYKMLERYHYLDFLHKLKDIMGKDGHITKEKIVDIKTIVNTTT